MSINWFSHMCPVMIVGQGRLGNTRGNSFLDGFLHLQQAMPLGQTDLYTTCHAVCTRNACFETPTVILTNIPAAFSKYSHDMRTRILRVTVAALTVLLVIAVGVGIGVHFLQQHQNKENGIAGPALGSSRLAAPIPISLPLYQRVSSCLVLIN
ncbi:hypothetical protein ABBQ38_012193 [Trebouxia sp. C0009 RCD-2024]